MPLAAALVVAPVSRLSVDRYEPRQQIVWASHPQAGWSNPPVTKDETIWDQAPFVPDGAPIITVAVSSDSDESKSIRLRRAAALFGTRTSCKFVLRHPTVCPKHCVIVNSGSQAILRNLDANAKTLRNGLKVQEEILNEADRLCVGPWKFDIGIDRREYAGTDDSPIIVDLEPDPTVLVIEDAVSGKLTKLTREVSTIGRSPHADVTIDDREVSSLHAIIFTYLHKPCIFDLASENGVWINGRRAAFAKLGNDTEISLGTHMLKFRCSAPGARAQSNGAQRVLKPTPFDNPEGTLSDLIDLSAESIAATPNRISDHPDAG